MSGTGKPHLFSQGFVTAYRRGHGFVVHPVGAMEPLVDIGLRAVRRSLRQGQLLDVTCWCERSVVRVAAVDVAQGRTGSCGRRGCAERTTVAS